MSIIRHGQGTITNLNPHQGNRRYLTTIGMGRGSGFGKLVQEVLARYPNATTTEQKAIGDFVIAESLNGNWDKYQDIFPMFLSNADDSRVGMKSMTLSLQGGTLPTKEAGKAGWEIKNDGALLMSAIPAAPFVLNNASCGYVATNNPPNDNNRTMIGSRTTGSIDVFMIRENSTAIGYDAFAHSASAITAFGTIFPLNVVVALRRNSVSNVNMFEDGASVDTLTETSTTVADKAMAVGATNTNGTLGQFATDAIINFAYLGAGDFDFAAQNANVKTMIADA